MHVLRFDRITKSDISTLSNVPWTESRNGFQPQRSRDASPSSSDLFADIGCPFAIGQGEARDHAAERIITDAMRSMIRRADALLRSHREHQLTEYAIRRSRIGLAPADDTKRIAKIENHITSLPLPPADQRPSRPEIRRRIRTLSFRDPETSPAPWSPHTLLAIKKAESHARLSQSMPAEHRLEQRVPLMVTPAGHFV